MYWYFLKFKCDAKPGTDDFSHLLSFPDSGHRCCAPPALLYVASQEPHTVHSNQYCSLLKHAKEKEIKKYTHWCLKV